MAVILSLPAYEKSYAGTRDFSNIAELGFHYFCFKNEFVA